VLNAALLASSSFFSRTGLANWGFRWIHILAGIVWIGMLYYFNLVQVPAFAEFEQHEGGAKARNVALDKVARRALWWFRWAAVSTFVTGLLIVGATKGYFSKATGTDGASYTPSATHAILLGMLLGTIMMLNVWGVIWRNQKTVLANAVNVLGGGTADPNAAAAGRRAFMASRTNVIFSVTMLFFMVFKGHAPYAADAPKSGIAFWIISLVLIALLELNALGLMPWKTTAKKGMNIVLESVQNVLIAAGVVWVIFLILSEVFLKA
jgi:uncharacterized membrane protein